MDLPSDLPSRYSKVTDSDFTGPVPPIPAKELRETVNRPGFIQWTDTSDNGVEFNLRPTKAQLKIDELNLDAMTGGGYVRMDQDPGTPLEPGQISGRKFRQNGASNTGISGYYTRGYGDGAAAPAPASTQTTPTAVETVSVTETAVVPASAAPTAADTAIAVREEHKGSRKLAILLGALVIGFIVGRLTARR